VKSIYTNTADEGWY